MAGTGVNIQSINHINYPDKRGRVYCRFYNELLKIEAERCFKCPLFNGTAQGMGVECAYDDLVPDDGETTFRPIPDPQNQLLMISRYMDEGMLPVDPISTESAEPNRG